MAEREARPALIAADEIPPQIAKQITHDYMDKYYRETLDAAVRALGKKSPRQAVRSAAGRTKVIKRLKLIENRSAQHDDGLIAEYDFGWMWAQLGLQEYRNCRIAMQILQNSESRYINATSTRECVFRACFAAKCRRMSPNAG